MNLDGQILTYQGHSFRITVRRDEDMGPPWKEFDGHGMVSDWTRREPVVYEQTLHASLGMYLYYDRAASYQKALDEGWDAPPYGGTPHEKAERAIAADFEYLRRWCNDEWWYIGMTAALLDADGTETGYAVSLWGIESEDVEYHAEVARELMADVYRQAGLNGALPEPAAPQRARLVDLLATCNAADAWL